MLVVRVLLALSFAAMPWGVYRVAGLATDLRYYVRWAAIAAPALFVTQHLSASLYGDAFGLTIGVLANAALAIRSALLVRERRRIEALAAGLGTDDHEAARAAVEEQLRRWWSAGEGPLRRKTHWTLAFVSRALVAEAPELALRWLDRLPADPSPLVRSASVQYRVSALVRLGDLATARSVLAATARPLPVLQLEQALQSVEALIAVLEGDPGAEARARAALASERLPAVVRVGYKLALVHALAARQAEDEARALLGELRAEEGERVLLRIARHGGPASALAQRLTTEERPYR